MIKLIRKLLGLCNHKWTRVQTYQRKSSFEQMSDHSPAFRCSNLWQHDFQRGAVVISECAHCGKVRMLARAF